MPDHRGIFNYEQKDQARVVDRLLSLKNLLRLKTSQKKIKEGEDLGVPARTLDKSLLVATWNLREFGSLKPKHGPRLDESFHYIAEIISAFDVVALQEVNDGLRDFHRLMQVLGQDWGYLLTDTTLGSAGNKERSAFVYDRRKVHFEGFASQVVIPPKKSSVLQFARTPFIAGFRSGDLRFTICSVHMYYGTSRALDPRRVKEIEALAQLLSERAKSDSVAWAPTTIVLGDFNIFNIEDATAKSLTDAGFYLPPQVAGLESGEQNGKHYDQIAVLSPVYDTQLREQARNARAGVVRMYESVFRDEDAELYKSAFPAKAANKDVAKYFREWRSYQMSDHRPRWLELKSDFGANRLGKWKKYLSEGKDLAAVYGGAR